MVNSGSRAPIGMFDSGLGGLTVARAVIDLLPHEDLVYFGDTARLPYGPRPADEVKRFAIEIMDLLVAQDVKMLVVACNSAASNAFDTATDRYDIPVISVIEPGVRAALAATTNRKVGLIGTEATVASHAYRRVLEATRENVTMIEQPCPLFVDFVERGDTTSDEVIEVAEEYLGRLIEAEVDTVILGCTHYPLLTGVIQLVMGEDVVLISSAEATATEVFVRLRSDELLNDQVVPGTHRFIASSGEGTFGELGRRFLGPEFGAVEHHLWG